MAHHRVWLASGLGALLTGALAVFPQASSGLPPERLRDTGLYADWTSRTVAPGHLPFSPQYPLWTDGAVKSRWISLPPGTWIDARDPGAWRFPVGTRLWKEFRFGRRAETRFIEHTAAGWRYATYVWNEDETEAVLAPERGVPQSLEIRDGVRHAIPSRTDCRTCHEAGPTRVLGFGALQLSPDRDPNAPHAEEVPPGGVDLRALVERGLLRNLPDGYLQSPPRIAARSATERAALGYLHANCGSCHVAGGELASLAFSLEYPVTLQPGEGPPAVVTALGRPSKFQVPGWQERVPRLLAGDPDGSVLFARITSRNPVSQMPPLGTRLVDEAAVKLLRQWIAEDLTHGRTELAAEHAPSR